MPDFSQLLRKPIAEAKRPPCLPIGDYPAKISRYELGESRQNKTPYVRLHVALTGAPDGMDPSDLDGIDLSKRQMRRDFYLTEDAYFRLAELIKSCNIEAEDFETAVPHLVGCDVLAEVQQYINQQTSEIGNEIRGLRGV